MKDKEQMNVKKDNEEGMNVNEHLKEMKMKSRRDERVCKIRRRNSSTRKALKYKKEK
jgi:hypothetical protein